MCSVNGGFPPPGTTSILAIENRMEIFTGCISCMPLTLSTQKLLNVSGQIVTNKGFIKKNNIFFPLILLVVQEDCPAQPECYAADCPKCT